MKRFYLLFKAICGSTLFIGLQQLIELKTHGFCLQKIQASDLPFQSRFEPPPLSLEEERKIRALLAQPFHMIGAGSECFAFASQDGQTVIKFFKLDHARPVYLHRGIFLENHSTHAGTLSDHFLTHLNLIPPFHEMLKRFLGMREYRLNRTFSSIKLSYDKLKEETGLLYLHLNPTTHLHQTLTLYDACGIAHVIDLDQTRFFLQKKAIPLEKQLLSWKKQGLHKQATQTIDAFLHLLLTRCQKGFADRDIVDRNFGVIGTEVIEIDSGSFFENLKMKERWIYRQELFYATLELKKWLKKHYPEMVLYLEEKVTEMICEKQEIL